MLAIALLLQTEVLHFFAWRNAEISAVLATVVWYALHTDVRRAAVFGLIAGVCEDVLATHTGAAFTISTTITATLAGMLASRFFADSLPLLLGIMFVATLVRNATFWIILSLQGYPSGYAPLHVHQTLKEAVMNGCVLLVVQLLLRWRAAAAQR